MAHNPKDGREPSKTLPRLRRSGCAATSYFESPLSSIISKSSVLNRSGARSTSNEQNLPTEPDRFYSLLDGLREKSSKGDGKKVSSIDIASVKATTFDTPRIAAGSQRGDVSPPVLTSKVLSSTLPSAHKISMERTIGKTLSDSGYEEFKALHSKLMNPEGKFSRALKNSRPLSSSLSTLSTDACDKKSQPSKRHSAMLTYEGSKGLTSGGSSPSRSPVQSRWQLKQYSSPDPTNKSAKAFYVSGANSEPEESNSPKSPVDRSKQNVFQQNYIIGCQKSKVLDVEKPTTIRHTQEDFSKSDYKDISKGSVLSEASKIKNISPSLNSDDLWSLTTKSDTSFSDGAKAKNILSTSPKDKKDEDIFMQRNTKSHYQLENISTLSNKESNGFKMHPLMPTKLESVNSSVTVPVTPLDLRKKECETDNFRSRCFTDTAKNRNIWDSNDKKNSSTSDPVSPVSPTRSIYQERSIANSIPFSDESRSDRKISFDAINYNDDRRRDPGEYSWKKQEYNRSNQAPSLGKVTGLFRRSVDLADSRDEDDLFDKPKSKSSENTVENMSDTASNIKVGNKLSKMKAPFDDERKNTFGSSTSIWIDNGLRTEDSTTGNSKGCDLNRFPLKFDESALSTFKTEDDWSMDGNDNDAGDEQTSTGWEISTVASKNGKIMDSNHDLIDFEGMLSDFATNRNGSMSILKDRFSDESRIETFSSSECQKEKKSAKFLYSKKENNIPEFGHSADEKPDMENRISVFRGSPNFRNNFEGDMSWKCTIEDDDNMGESFSEGARNFSREEGIRTSMFGDEMNKENHVFSSQSAAFRSEKMQRSIILNQRSSTKTVTRRLRIGQRTVRRTSRYTRNGKKRNSFLACGPKSVLEFDTIKLTELDFIDTVKGLNLLGVQKI
ncbi:uncharacterized protein TNCT_495751 [Trichonephila clavata]|uniref:Uncharacterized protein n=1 Tax=Trichonephila clavata TaxID=2740835 RepID=A0A8X6IQG7_TRICU|nr:uncharacterized protein TNCT_495751 [Trichonephila clavata]